MAWPARWPAWYPTYEGVCAPAWTSIRPTPPSSWRASAGRPWRQLPTRSGSSAALDSMPKLLALLLLLMPPACCTTPRTPTTPALTKCRIPAIPGKPPLHPSVCGDSVCITVDEAKALATYLIDADEARRSLEGCSLVQLVPQ